MPSLKCALTVVVPKLHISPLELVTSRHALATLGFDPDVDEDQLDLHFSPFDSFDFYKSLDLQVREGGFSISATELGEGVQNALVLAVLRAFEERRKKGAIFLIEEPEMFLHPQMQRSLYKTLRGISETNQVIYTTHSPHFVSIPEYDEIAIVRKGRDGTKVTTSALSTNKQRREKLIKELDPERGELFFASRLLLVEGDTEKLALPEYAKHLDLDLDKAGATVVEAGGKRSLPELANIAISFEIPTAILYDEDSSDFKNNKQDEAAFNSSLDALDTGTGRVMVRRFTKNYEDHLKAALGEARYQALCNTHSGVSKAVRARLIAAEPNAPVPEPIPEILRWLTSKPRTAN
jgi:putative ATP-dependent endonuclease of the OLD family